MPRIKRRRRDAGPGQHRSATSLNVTKETACGNSVRDTAGPPDGDNSVFELLSDIIPVAKWMRFVLDDEATIVTLTETLN